jgi:glycosyltransferase involved in cell wall biosynthesis
MTLRIIVPRLVDTANVNAQNLNARSLLAHFGAPDCAWHCVSYGKPDPAVVANRRVKVTRLAPRRVWPWHVALFYQQPADAIFYPGVEWFDRIGLQCRDRTRRHVPVIATLEGLAGDAEREARVSRIAGHPVHCQRVSTDALRRVDELLTRADRIVAISPFLAKVGRELYGDKFSVLPLGVDVALFSPNGGPPSPRPKRVIGVGNVRKHKRPDVFLGLAERFADVQFCWIGDGDRRSVLVAEAARRGLKNISFRGALARAQVAAELRAADVFVMPSRAEGVPKATQEAVASGLPCIVFGHYESPSVIDGENGYVVWSDGELERRLAELLDNNVLRAQMGSRGAEMARAWDWGVVAPQWERRVHETISRA